MRSIFLVTVFFLLSLFSHSQEASAADTGAAVGKYAPPIELKDLVGKSISLARFKGTVVLLNFWSTLCKPCTAEMPSLNRLQAALKDNGLQVIAVSIDATDRPVRDFTAANNITFTVLVDKEKEVFFDEYAAPSLPASYLVDRSGIIIEKFTGPREWDSPEMKDHILKLLEMR